MSERRDFTLTEGDNGDVLVHRPDCPMVLEHRAAGRPLLTLMGCANSLGATDFRRHHCLDADA